MAIEFGQILPDGIPGYEGGVVVTPEIVTDTTLTTSPDTPRPRQPVPTNQTTTAESIGTPGSSDQFPSRTDWEQEPDPVVTLPKRYGAHKSVIDKLSQISFVSGCTGGEMSDAIAYIRYWSRSGVSQKNPVQLSQQFTLPDSKSNELSTTLSNLYGSDIDFSSTQYSLPENYRPADAFKGTPVNRFNSQYDFTTPEFNPSVTVPEQTQSGSVYAANPSGSTESSSAPANDAVWQFLFNPEELQLSSGPEYNRAESWGVSDPTNSGQPLSWRMNRNRKLTFGKVLLHGYTFGKRVDSLEKGLQDLFMAREGEGSDGPPVLEFVWGKRHFGPCVIQNIQVREKAWDKGILVNAEVSFELEQVPEWTINDGFVDVLRPGRQPTVNDPSIASENYRATPSSPAPTGEDDPPGNKPGGGGGEPQLPGDPDKCFRVQKEVEVWKQVEKKAGEELGSIFTGKDKYNTIAEYYENAYDNKQQELDLRPYLNKTNPGCLTSFPGGIYVPDHRRAVAYIHTCTRRIVDAYNTWLIKEGKSGGRCVVLKSARLAEEKKEAEKKKAKEEAKKCERYDSGKPCTNTQLGSRITCLGIKRICARKSGGFFWAITNY